MPKKGRTFLEFAVTIVSFAPGDAAEIRGEYVAPDNGKDLIHFTHPADGSCGTKGSHPDGGIRKLDAAALKKAA